MDPGAPHTLESLAAIAYCSPSHFHRVYRSLAGESVAETVQRVRLAHATRRLSHAACSIGSVAGAAGYDSPQAFARAFRGLTGMSPSAFQARQQHLAAARAGRDDAALPRAPLDAPDLPAVELADIPPADVLCLHHEGPVATIGQTFRTLYRTLGIDRNCAASARRIGLCWGNPEQSDSFRYFAGIVPATPIEPCGPVQTIRTEGGLYAMHRLAAPYALIAPTFQALFGGWLPRSGYTLDDRPTLELYRSAPPSRLRDRCVTDLLIAVRRP